MANKIIVAILAFLLMNYCVVYNSPYDTRHIYSDEATIYSYSSVNEIESVFELVTEEWMDLENYVPEQDSEDTPEDYSKVKTLYAHTPLFASTRFIAKHTTLQYNIPAHHHFISFCADAPTPPPDFA